MTVEVKASERHKGRLTAGEITRDILKLDALRIEARARNAEILPVVLVVDVAPEENERMLPPARRLVEKEASEKNVGLFYISPLEEVVILPNDIRSTIPRV